MSPPAINITGQMSNNIVLLLQIPEKMHMKMQKKVIYFSATPFLVFI